MWTLLLARASDPPGAFFDRRLLDMGQIKVGRSAKSCDLVLPDDQGFVSRDHCTISVQGLDVFVVDTSVNGVALNRPDARIAPNMPVAVRPEDRLLIGDFVITLKTEAAGAGVGLAPPAPPPLPMTPSGLGGGDDWFASPGEPVWDESPMGGSAVHDFLGDAMSDFLAPSTPVAPMGPGAAFGPGDALGQAFSRPILADPLPPPADFGIPEDWAIGPSPAAAAPFPDFAPPPTQPRPAPAPTDDPFDLSAPIGPAPAAPGPWADPPPVAPAPAPTVSAGSAAWDAFFEGAGLGPDELRLAPDAMRRLGVLYRQAVLGLSDIIQDRAAFKDEFRVERTQLTAGRNNPLKHLPPIEAAKVLLGEPALPGFMDSEETVRTAFEDIKKHQLAMLAGVQAALVAVFDRLSPAEIDKLVEKAAGAKKGFTFGRGIDRWSVYQTLFEALRKDATSNANGVMSVAFRDGYEKFLKSA